MEKINQLHKFLNKIDEIVFIVDDSETICWTNCNAKKSFKELDIENKKFKNVFFTNNEVKLGNNVKDELGRRFLVKYFGELEIGKYKKIVIIESLEDYNNEKIKIHCLEQIIQKIDSGIILSDYEGKVVLYNEVQAKIGGNKKDDVIGKYLWNVYEYGEGEKSEHRSVYKTKKPIKNKYGYMTYKNGNIKSMCYNTYPIEKDGQVVGVFSVSKNERILHEVLQETIQLRRELVHKIYDEDKSCNKKVNSIMNDNGTIYEFQNIIGGEKISKIIKEAQNMALLENNILIIGETGTGKEVFAQSIHNYSNARNGPFLPINCGAIPENLLESILFGTVKGAYTGALDTKGLFEEAKNGTIFLDELNSMPISMQIKLLRVLQERKVRRIGGSKMYPIECRVISAMNENPKEMMKNNTLRVDLFYRLSSFIINIPPLRERKEDIDLFVKSYFDKYNFKLNKNINSISDNLQKILYQYNWPGNIRELEYIIENMMIRCEDYVVVLTEECIPEYLKGDFTINKDEIIEGTNEQYSLTEILNSIEKKIILETLEENKWNITKSSRKLNIIRQSLIYRMKKLGIKKGIKDKDCM